MATRKDLVAAARRLVGTPYGMHGRTPGAALDCAGVLSATLALCGIAIVARWDYPAQPSHDVADAWLARFCTRTELDRLAPGDAIHFDYRGHAHLGLWTGSGIVTVRPAPGGFVVEQPLPASRRVYSAWQLPGVSDG